MKKINRIILTAILALMLLFSLSGCSALDQMRSEQAYNLGYGTIKWNGNTYKALPLCDHLNPQMDYTASIYITDEDVPVLLSTVFYQERLDVSKEKDFLYAPWVNVYYCREELHADLSLRIKEPFVPDMVCYEYTVYNEDNADFETKYYKLTEGQLEGLEEILRSDPLPNNDIMWEDQYWGLTLYKCSEDLLFKKDYMDIYSTGYGYFLLVRSDSGAEELYAVPTKFDELIHAITAEFKINNGLNIMETVPLYGD